MTVTVVAAGDRRERFDGATAAMRFAVDVVRRAERAGSSPLPRVGVACADEEVSAASRAARLVGLAAPGDVLLDGVVQLLVSGQGFTLVPAEATAGSVPVFRCEWRTADAGLRVVVADDAVLVRSGIVRLLADEGFEVVGQTGDADELVGIVERTRPDLVVTDIRMPPTNTDDGLRAAAAIRQDHPDVAVLVLSQHVEARAAANLLDDRAAGVGYLLKERVTAIDEFLETCHRLVEGGRVVDPIIAAELVRSRGAEDPLDRLTEREREVLGLMAQGASNARIAGDLHLSPKTLEAHVRSIFLKLDLAENADEHRRVAAVVRWLRARSG